MHLVNGTVRLEPRRRLAGCRPRPIGSYRSRRFTTDIRATRVIPVRRLRYARRATDQSGGFRSISPELRCRSDDTSTGRAVVFPVAFRPVRLFINVGLAAVAMLRSPACSVT